MKSLIIVIFLTIKMIAFSDIIDDLTSVNPFKTNNLIPDISIDLTLTKAIDFPSLPKNESKSSAVLLSFDSLLELDSKFTGLIDLPAENGEIKYINDKSNEIPMPFKIEELPNELPIPVIPQIKIID